MRAIFYDTETTGVRHDKDRIIEIAAFDAESKQTFVSLINPEMPIPPEASAIHHITDDMVKQSPTFAQLASDFANFCTEDAVLIAHNNEAFDKLFLSSEFARTTTPLPSWRYFDTLKWARKYRPDLPRHTLQSLREHFGILANQAHRALDDVIILHEVFSRMVDDLSLQTILDLMEGNFQLSHMPFGKYRGKPLAEIPKSYVAWLKENGVFEKKENVSLRESFEKLGILVN